MARHDRGSMPSWSCGPEQGPDQPAGSVQCAPDQAILAPHPQMAIQICTAIYTLNSSRSFLDDSIVINNRIIIAHRKRARGYLSATPNVIFVTRNEGSYPSRIVNARTPEPTSYYSSTVVHRQLATAVIVGSSTLVLPKESSGPPKPKGRIRSTMCDRTPRAY